MYHEKKYKIITPGLFVECETREYRLIGPEFLKEMFLNALPHIVCLFLGPYFQQ